MKSFIYELLNKLNAGVLIVDEDFRIVHCNYWLAKRMECDAVELVNLTLDQLAPKFTTDLYRQILLEVFRTGRGRFLSGAIHKSFFSAADETDCSNALQNLQIDRLCVQGKYVLMIQVQDVSKENYKVMQMKHFIKQLEVENDIIKQSEAKNRQMAYYDSLSNIPNRAYFMMTLSKWIHETEKNGTPLGLFFIDLDKLKTINDSYGHRTGDAVIVEFANRLVERCSEHDFVARLSGDEFAILKSGFSGKSDLEKHASEIMQAMCLPLMANHISLNVTCSLGISIYNRGLDSQELFIERADKALYLSKNNGRNQFQFYSNSH